MKILWVRLYVTIQGAYEIVPRKMVESSAPQGSVGTVLGGYQVEKLRTQNRGGYFMRLSMGVFPLGRLHTVFNTGGFLAHFHGSARTGR